ncbi:hypothetical protein GCM10009116_10480 [Brevundimonas basaltis]
MAGAGSGWTGAGVGGAAGGGSGNMGAQAATVPTRMRRRLKRMICKLVSRAPRALITSPRVWRDAYSARMEKALP